MANLDEPQWLSARELADAYAAREVSPVEIAEGLLMRIEALDAGLNAICHSDHATTLHQAQASEERWAAGEPLGPLDGVPVAIKDLLLTKGWPTLRGSLTVDRNQAWDEDAPSVARLREAGAVFVGKTTSPEFGWKGTTDSPLTGITRNPWNRNKTPGGSSGGASAALAAGYCPIAHGTDAGGSIRIPASFAGVYGLKPSFGRVAAYPLSPFGTLAHVGPMARTVEDAALFLNCIVQPDVRDWFNIPFPPTDFTATLEQGVKGARIAFSPRLGYAYVDKEVAAIVARAVRTFEALGAEVEQVEHVFEDPTPIFDPLFAASAYYLLGKLPPEKKALLEPALAELVEYGAKVTYDQYLIAVNQRGKFGAQVRGFMQHFDFLLTPTLAVPAFDVGRLVPLLPDGSALNAWTLTQPFNLTQQPAASINCGFTAAGLPVGLQIVGRMYDDAGVLRASRAYEQANPLYDRHPDL